MRNFVLSVLFLCLASATMQATERRIISPDGKLVVCLSDEGGKLTYTIDYDGKQMLTPSSLGLITDIGDYSRGLSIGECRERKVDTVYQMSRTKMSQKHYVANVAEVVVKAAGAKRPMTLEMQVSNNDVAYRYLLEGSKSKTADEPRRTTVLSEASSFCFPSKTTTFVCPQIDGDHKGWMSTKPSYEEEYLADAAMNVKSKYGLGYTFPCLFRVGNDGWVLLSETGVGSNYCGSHISDYTDGGYRIAYPDATEFHGLGSTTPGLCLPGATPWRTITVGSTLKPIVETTISYDVVEQMYEPRENYKPGRYTWSWLIWQDNSINYRDQKEFVDVAASMGFEYCLVDNWWDDQIGRDKIAELSQYALSKGVSLMLWYNSNGYANDAPQTPRNCMQTAIQREREMAWLEKIGVKGIKVDFFAGDKQQTLQQYEDILSDANRHGIQVIFHGCTVPRGWERMYPNFVASEAVLASENVYFSEYHAKLEGFQLTMHPFCRNATASMDWGGSMMNHYFSKNNKERHRRYTSDTFEMASAIINQTSIQCICMQKSNLTELPEFEIDFLKSVPTTWDDTQFVDGYPTKYAVLARRNGDKWYVAGLNGEQNVKTLKLSLPMFAGKTVTFYTDEAPRKNASSSDFLVPVKKTLKVDKKGFANVTLQPLGGIIITE